MAKVAQKGVRSTHKDYDRLSPKWQRIRDVVEGQDAVTERGEVYLEKLAKMTPEQYTAYKRGAGFFNATSRAAEGMVGMIFRIPPVTDLPAGVEELLKDVTMSGQDMEAFSKEIVGDKVQLRRIGILVDHPAAVEGVSPITVAAAQLLGLRPTMQIYRTESIINWKYRRIRNQNTLCQVVLKECATEPDGEFAEKEKDQYRVLDLDDADQYRVRVFEADKDGKDELVEGPLYPLMNGQPLDTIPFYIDYEVKKPPLLDLANSNLQHYELRAPLRRALKFAVPTAVLTGVDEDEAKNGFYVGSAEAWVFRRAEATAQYLELKGDTIPQFQAELNALKQEMAVAGARMLADEKEQVETLGATAIKRTGENSILANIAIETSTLLEKALTTFCKWAGHDVEVKYQLNRDFMPYPMTFQELTALVGAWQAGAISEAELFENLQRGEIIAPGKKLDEHQAEVEAQGPPAPAKPEPKPGEGIAA